MDLLFSLNEKKTIQFIFPGLTFAYITPVLFEQYLGDNGLPFITLSALIPYGRPTFRHFALHALWCGAKNALSA